MGSSSASMAPGSPEAEPTPELATPALAPACPAVPDAPEVTPDENEAEELVQLARPTLDSEVPSPNAAQSLDSRELECMQCESLLFEPTTLEDGFTVCRPCVKKRRLATPEPTGADVPWGGTAPALGFGSATNVILSDLLGRCPEAQTQAAEARQRGNRLFGDGKYLEACEAYSEAMSKSPDIVVLCNRSLARLKLEDTEAALADAQLAVAKASICSGPAMLAKAWLRVGQALGQSSAACAAYALARGGAAASDLQELCSKMSRNDLQKVKDWLRDGRCPPIEDTLPALDKADKADKANPEFDEDWLRSQLECPLCLGLLWEPSSIPCGHTLCRSCLARTLDHAFDTSPSCPMCRAELSGYLAWLNARAWTQGAGAGAKLTHGGAQIPVNRQIAAIIEKHFPAESRERQAQIAMAEAEATGAPGGAPGGAPAPVVPIFICSMAMPAVACPLHIFEPRYRLMMRRCIDSGQRQFGMCLFPGAQFGTMLHIKSFKQLQDGRSQIKMIGTRRFEVLEWGEKDGYATGRVRWVEDTKATDNTEGPTTAAVRLRKAVDSLLQKVPAQDRAALEEQLGPTPCTDGSDGPNCPNFVFWCMGLADLPPRICYELCFGASFREDAEKRLTTMLDIYEKKIRARRDDQADQTE